MTLKNLIALTHSSVPFLKAPDYQFVPLTFNQSTGTGIDQFGNPTGRTTFIVQAHLYITSSQEVNPNPAQGQQNKIYRGHAINPKILPLWIVAGASGVCTLAEREYRFTLRSIDRTSMPAYAQAFGERLELELFSNSKSI